MLKRINFLAISQPALLQRAAALRPLQQTRSKVLVPYCHPFEYFRDSPPPKAAMPAVYHPTPFVPANAANDGALETAQATPLYFKITLNRSVIGLPWYKRYWTGVLFKKYSPLKELRPKSVRPRLSVQTVIYREATPEIMKMILQLKEILKVENIWTEAEYRSSVKPLLGKRGLTDEQLQARRGYYVIGTLA